MYRKFIEHSIRTSGNTENIPRLTNVLHKQRLSNINRTEISLGELQLLELIPDRYTLCLKLALKR
jgi:hypothetical protein